MKNGYRSLAALTVLCALSLALAAQDQNRSTSQKTAAVALPSTFVAKVIGVADGDTLRVSSANVPPVTVKLDSIDAPEMTQPFGHEAQKRLAELAAGQVTVKWKEKDKNGRLLGIVYKGEMVINRQLVVEGFAWQVKESKSAVLADAEKLARRDKVSLWGDANPIAPWDWRNGVRPQESPKPATAANTVAPAPAAEPRPEAKPAATSAVDATVYVTKSGTKYHRAGCQYLSKSSAAMPLSRAKEAYSPCSRCNPPR